MESAKKESEAFNMLKFMYQDDDDDMEDAERAVEKTGYGDQEPHEQIQQSGGEESESRDFEQQESKGTYSVFPVELLDRAPLQQLDTSTLSSRRDRLTIVDYGHDEVAMSPEAEEGEILANVRFMHNRVANSAIVDLQDSALADDVVMLSTPTVHLTSPPVQIENSESEAFNDSFKETKMDGSAGAYTPEDVDPLDRFLSSPPKEKCPVDLQDRINKFLAYKRQGKSFNSEVRNRKDYRNPDFLLHAVSYQGIDQVGSCFSKYVFDPHGYDEKDFYDAIEVDMKLEMERKEQAKKKSPKVDFVTGGTQQAAVLAAGRSIMSVSGGVQSASVSIDDVSRDSRQNKKSKWDKVDGDQLGGLTSVGAHASLPLPPAPNVGSGYAMFLQQKRREAEERISTERKVGRRS